MNTLFINKVKFTKETPSSEGQYLWKGDFGSVELINVCYYPPKEEYSISWEGYFGIPSMRGHNVSQLQGSFIKIEFN